MGPAAWRSGEETRVPPHAKGSALGGSRRAGGVPKHNGQQIMRALSDRRVAAGLRSESKQQVDGGHREGDVLPVSRTLLRLTHVHAPELRVVHLRPDPADALEARDEADHLEVLMRGDAHPEWEPRLMDQLSTPDHRAYRPLEGDRRCNAERLSSTGKRGQARRPGCASRCAAADRPL